MRKFYYLLATLSLLFANIFCALDTSAQITAANYYYNDFEGNILGTGITQTSTDASLQASDSSPLSGAYSLSSNGNGKVGTYRFSFINSAASLNTDNEKYGWEWTMVYRNTGGNTADPTMIDNNENSWKYWLYSNNTDVSNMQGYYLTQVGSSMNIYMRINTEDRLVLSYDLSAIGGNNTTYAIRVQRINVNGYTFRLFVDPYTPTKQSATTLRAQLLNSGDNNTYNKYNYSGLQLASTTAGRFKFDEIKMYSRKIEISGANEASNGISNPLYNGQKDAAIYGLRFKTRGLFAEVYKIRLEIEQTGWFSFADIVENARLFRSEDDYFGNADDVLINKNQQGGAFNVVVDYRALYADNFETQVFATVGAKDGSVTEAGYLFFKVDVKGDASEKGSFNVKKPTFIGNDNSSINFMNDGVFVGNTGTTPTPSGKVFDWVGGTAGNQSSWHTASNWSQNAVPGTNDVARIGVAQSFAHQPMISTSTTIGNLIIGGTQSSLIPTLNINGSTSLTINGAFTNSRKSKISGTGNFVINGSWSTSGGEIDLATGSVNINFSGTKAQSIRDDGSNGGAGVVFGNIGFYNAGIKTLTGSGKFAVAVGKYLTMGASTTLQTSGLLTLKSSASGSASVANIPSSSAIKGNVTVERFIQGGSKSMWRTYRMFSSPVYDNGNSANRTYSFNQFIDDMLVTGKSEGFDQLGNSATSAWTYNNGFIIIPSVNTSVNVGRGAYLLYRGDRSNPAGKVTAPFVDAESIVMTYKGELNQQNITVPLTHGSTGISLLGNPYAATIDWNAVTKTSNVGNIIRTWNPSTRQYATFNGMDGLNGGSQYISAGQGFFVQTTDGNAPTVTFTESSKVGNVAQATPSQNGIMSVTEQDVVGKMTMQGKAVAEASSKIAMQSTTVKEVPAKIRIKLTRDGFENEDETLVVLKRDESASFEGYDVARSDGEAVFLSSLSAEKTKMGINYMPHISEIQTVNLDVNVTNNGDYKMHFILTGVPVGYEVKLKDKYLNTITDLANEGTVYSLAIDKTVGTTMGDRFELQVEPVKTLPVVLTDFTAEKTIDGALLKWKTSSEVNNSGFDIQRAGDDHNFATIGTVNATHAGSYNFLDKTPLSGNNYYRLVEVDLNGKQTPLAKIVDLKFELNAANGILIYPTLIQSTFTMKFNGSLSSKQYVFRVSDVSGKEVYHKVLSKEEIANGFVGELSTMPSGIYFAALVDSANGSKVGTSKLIKK